MAIAPKRSALHRIRVHDEWSMPSVEIYTWRTCPFCVRAKQLLDRKGVAYTE